MSSVSCATSDPLPPWFDAIDRLPLKSVTVNGHRIAYLDQGQGPPVLLIHGFGGSMWQWEYQQAALAGQFRVITPDLLGAGFSDKPDIEYTPEQLLDFLTGFLDALQIPKAAMIGNSMGAGLAIGLALDHPTRVTSLVLIDGLPPKVLDHLGSPTLRRALTTPAPSWLVSFGNWLFGGQMLESTLREFIHDPALLTPAVLDRSNRNRQRPGLFRALLTVGTNLPRWEREFAPRIGTITQPTLVIWGEEDRVFPLAVGDALHRLIPGSQFLRVPNAGHIPQWEQPDLVNVQIRSFLAP
ncbi:MAG: alpha/beta fold hydrolase [Nitrospira sp.]